MCKKGSRLKIAQELPDVAMCMVRTGAAVANVRRRGGVGNVGRHLRSGDRSFSAHSSYITAHSEERTLRDIRMKKRLLRNGVFLRIKERFTLLWRRSSAQQVDGRTHRHTGRAAVCSASPPSVPAKPESFLDLFWR